jgi:peptide/nickel transport system substrate-binding protein
MKRTRQWLGAALGALALCFALGQPWASAQDAGNRLVVSQSSDTLTLDPSVDTSPISLNIFKNIYDQLTDIAADGSVAPLLATEWESSEDAKVWTFTIKPDVKFHDGSTLTVDDVVWSYTKIMEDEKSPVAAYLSGVEKVEAVGDNQVRFTLKEPFAPFDRQVSLISILPQKVYEELGADTFSQEPVGSGPFKVVTWVKDDRVELESFADYHNGAPEIGTVIFRPVPSESARSSALLSGELDIVPILPPALMETLATRDGIRVEKVQSNRVLYLGFDVNQTVLGDVKLRQAIDHAIDREAITTQLLRGLGEPVGQVVAPVTFGYDPAIEPTTYDVELAKKLVEESDYSGEPILFQYPNNRYAFGQEVAQAVAGYLQAVGIQVDMQGMEYSAFFPLWLNKKLNGMHMFAYGPSIMDAELPLRSLYETGPSRGYWSNPEVDELIKAQRAESDPEKRKELISQVWQISKENAPYVILYNEIQGYGIRDGVNWKPRPDERLLFDKASVEAQ